MNLVLLGPPGAGKGTQASFLKERFGLEHVSSGDLLREAVREETELGKEAKSYMDSGALVPDSLVIELIKNKIDTIKSKGFLLDGFPRNEKQGKTLKEMLLKLKREITFVFYIAVDDDVILERLSSRRSCSECGAPYNLKTSPPKVEGKCDKCNSDLVHRDDDTIATVRERLETYNLSTKPLLTFYKREGLLKEVNGVRPISEIAKEIETLVTDRKT